MEGYKFKALSKRLKRVLKGTGIKLAVAESLTSGTIQSIIGLVSGSSEYFRGGITAYSIDSKEKLLEVNREEAELVNCVSERTVNEMALGVCKLFGANASIATTGYAEKCLSRGEFYPNAYIAVCIRGLVFTKKSGDLSIEGRNQVQAYISKMAIGFFIEKLNEWHSKQVSK